MYSLIPDTMLVEIKEKASDCSPFCKTVSDGLWKIVVCKLEAGCLTAVCFGA